MTGWSLFTDWCLSREHELAAVTPEALDEFFTDVPVAPSTRRARARSIRGALAAAGIQLDEAAESRATTWHTDNVGPALAQLPTLRFPTGLRGRRDGWLLVLVGALGLSRAEALRVTTDDVVLYGGLRVAARPVARAAIAAECPLCAVHRWLRVVGPAANGYRSEIQLTLDPRGADPDAHDCEVGLDGTWRVAPTLLPSIDRHGWLRNVPLSAVAVSNIMAVRQRDTGFVERATARRVYDGPYAEATSAQLADAYDDVDARLTELLARTAELLGSTDDMLESFRRQA